MKEVELAQKFVSYLSCYDLYFEIPQFHTDIVARDGNILMAYEIKTSLNFKVIEQAQRNTYWFHYSYVCVPKSKDDRFQINICQIFGIGILFFESRGTYEHIWEGCAPKLNRHAHKTRNYVSQCLTDYSKRSLPGASGSNGTTITPFSLTKEGIISYLKRHNGVPFKELYENVPMHYYSMKGAKSSLYQWIRKGVIKDFYIDRGKVYLSESSTIINQ